MITHRNASRALALAFAGVLFAACDKNTVQELPFAPLLATRVKFFNFGVNAPGVNFYADQQKLAAVQSGTGSEATTGVAYGGVGNGNSYTQVASGTHTLTGRIAAGKYYSLYMTGFYNTTTKTVDAFLLEDPVAPPADFTVAYIRFVNTMSNAAHPLILYAGYTTGDTTKVDTLSAGLAYQGASTLATLPVGIYNLFARYQDSTANKISRTSVTFLGGHIYTVGARGDITVTSTTATNRPFLDNATNW